MGKLFKGECTWELVLITCYTLVVIFFVVGFFKLTGGALLESNRGIQSIYNFTIEEPYGHTFLFSVAYVSDPPVPDIVFTMYRNGSYISQLQTSHYRNLMWQSRFVVGEFKEKDLPVFVQFELHGDTELVDTVLFDILNQREWIHWTVFLGCTSVFFFVTSLYAILKVTHIFKQRRQAMQVVE